ncbi:MAG: hypothetical protein ACRDZQ_06520 [Acidimicrobiales bacterium]
MARRPARVRTPSWSRVASSARYAAAFDREDLDEVGRRAPFFGMFPLRIWYRLRTRSNRR